MRFQLDSRASCNVISAKAVENGRGQVKLKDTTRMLSMPNRTTVKPQGHCQLELSKQHQEWQSVQVEFTVLKEE